MMRRPLWLCLALLLGLATNASAQAGPTGRGNYLNLHGELAARYPGETFTVPSGLYLDWGAFQNGVVATGTRLGLSRADRSLGTALFFGGGPQFHLRITDQVMLVPAFNLGYRISQQGTGMLGLASFAVAYTHDRFYVGLEAETMAFGQSPIGWQVFPGTLSAHALLGMYY